MDSNIKAHHELIQSEAFQKSEDMALMEYSRKVAIAAGKDANPQVASMVAGWKLIGAQEFLSEFHNLAEKPVDSQPTGPKRTLDHSN